MTDEDPNGVLSYKKRPIIPIGDRAVYCPDFRVATRRGHTLEIHGHHPKDHQAENCVHPKRRCCSAEGRSQESKRAFDEFDKVRSAARKRALVAQICQELTIHATLEEEIFYPAFKMASKDRELVPEAQVEHASVKELIAQVEGVEPDGEMYDARAKVMGEFVKHHVKEEQNEMFPKAAKSRLDLVQLRDAMLARKQELLGES